ncbi:MULTISPECIES: 16S rRNA (guanine(527)-N(7))-methyltransferase RsmG [Candidatus Ichthyocystis]|uniref:16S rRNA (guanine(527)-N(7))-methyltransferase RsmG n=1 Tax=Candidatus Ichthyocystis TaxID=2929841 RepID=UPI000A3D97BC|nr:MULTISPECIES: 16S rRNA (guanine(527)-N(7))-methyltransferase RsmG [Ichthyocystis]
MSDIEFLSEALARQKILVTKKQLDKLYRYANLILNWNRVYNLTSVKVFDEVVIRHIVDSLSVVPYLSTRSFFSLLDVGSGAGLPGIPLSVVYPDVNFCLLEAREKRCIFLSQVKAELDLPNADVKWCRVRDFVSDEGYDVIISRAFSSLSEFVLCSRHLCGKGGCWYAMKGAYPEHEVRELSDDFVVLEWWPIKFVDTRASRCLLRIARKV